MVMNGVSLLSPTQGAQTYMSRDEAGHRSNFCEESNLERKKMLFLLSLSLLSFPFLSDF